MDGKRPVTIPDRVSHFAQFRRLIEVSNMVASQSELQPLLQHILNTAAELVTAEFGVMVIFDEDRDSIQLYNINEQPRQLPGNPDLQDHLNQHRSILRLEDAGDHPQAVILRGYCPEMGPLLSVPLVPSDHLLGVLFAANLPGGQPFTEDDEGLLQVFAVQAAIAIEHARLSNEVDELARLRERHRIAQALHDSLAQILFTIGLEAKLCLRQPNIETEVKQGLQKIGRLASRCHDEVRSAIFALRSDSLPGRAGLIELLQDQINEFEAQSGIATTLIGPATLRNLPPLVSEAIYRIVRESLANVHKHAQASVVVVNLHCDQDGITVTILDNGVGLHEPLRRETDDHDLNFGVTIMRQLTAQAQGKFFITNNEDEGVIVKAHFPISGSTLT